MNPQLVFTMTRRKEDAHLEIPPFIEGSPSITSRADLRVADSDSAPAARSTWQVHDGMRAGRLRACPG
jgi:hypothetical protein